MARRRVCVCVCTKNTLTYIHTHIYLFCCCISSSNINIIWAGNFKNILLKRLLFHIYLFYIASYSFLLYNHFVLSFENIIYTFAFTLTCFFHL